MPQTGREHAVADSFARSGARWRCALVAAAGLVGLAVASVLAGDEVTAAPTPTRGEWAPIPGVREFTGRVTAKPRTIQELIASGMDANAAAQQDALARARLAAGLVRHFAETDEYLVEVPAGQDDGVFAAMLWATGEYAYAEPDWLVYPASVPSDARFGEQYHHRLMQSTLAWDLTTGSSSIVVAMVDTGANAAHPDLVGRLVPGFNAASNLAQLDGGVVDDIVGHGTMVAGAAGATGSNGVGVVGMGWGLSLMPVRASNLSNGAAALSTINAGARWAAEHGARVVSVSYTGVQSPTVQATGAHIKSVGGLLVWTAGNGGQNWSAFDWPDVIVVGGTGPDDVSLLFSGFGNAVDCVAPGSDILTTTMAGGYAPVDGTSFSTPIVAGVLGLIWSADPDLSPSQAETALLAGCNDLGDAGDDVVYGRGRVNAYRSVALVARGPDAPIPTPDSAVTGVGMPITLDVLGNDFDPAERPLSIESFTGSAVLGGTVTRSAGTGPGGRDELVFSPGGSGTDGFTYVVSNGVMSRPVEVVVSVAPPTLASPRPGSGGQPGLDVKYFDLLEPTLVLPSFAGLSPIATTIWPALDFASSEGDFADSFRTDDVAALAQGLLHVPVDGLYRIGVESDDGARVAVSGLEIVRNDGLHAMTRTEGVMGLQAGIHGLRVEFFERRFGAGLRVTIAGPGIPEQALSGVWLSHVEADLVDINADGDVNPDDLSDFISFYFTFDPRADFNGDGTLDPDDLSDYIAAYFTR